MRPVTPLDLWRTGWTVWMMGLEAQAVIAMRLMGMAGLWNTTRGEPTRMVTEKATAGLLSAQAATRAAMQGKSPTEVMDAALRPVRARTKSNTRRLTRRGPATGG